MNEMQRNLVLGACAGFVAGAAFWYLRRRGGVTMGTLPPASVAPTAGSLVGPSYSAGPQGEAGDVSMPDLSSAEAFIASLSDEPSTRSQQLYKVIISRPGPDVLEVPSFVNVTMPIFNGHEATVQVVSDSVKLFGIRININQYYGQLVTDFFGGVAMTKKVANAVYENANFVPLPTTYDQLPGLRPGLADMAKVRAMVLHSQGVDKKLAALGDVGSPDAIRANLGKDWLLNASFWAAGLNGPPYCGRPGTQGSIPMSQTAVNYGWWLPGTPVDQPIQGAANCHDFHHSDYSQVLRFISGYMLVDGAMKSTADVLMDPEYAGLLIDEEALPGYRHPGVPVDEAVVS